MLKIALVCVMILAPSIALAERDTAGEKTFFLHEKHRLHQRHFHPRHVVEHRVVHRPTHHDDVPVSVMPDIESIIVATVDPQGTVCPSQDGVTRRLDQAVKPYQGRVINMDVNDSRIFLRYVLPKSELASPAIDALTIAVLLDQKIVIAFATQSGCVNTDPIRIDPKTFVTAQQAVQRSHIEGP